MRRLLSALVAAVAALGLMASSCASADSTNRSSPVSSDPLDAAVDPTPVETVPDGSPEVPDGTTAAPPDELPETAVLGVSIRTSSIGLISIAPGIGAAGVELAVLETQVDAADADASIALAQNGEIIASTRVMPGHNVDLPVVEAGDYEVWAIGTGPDVVGDDGIKLAGAQTIERVGDITIK